MLGGHAEPGHDGFFFEPLQPIDGGQAVPFSPQGQTFTDQVLSVMPVIKNVMYLSFDQRQL
jgi:hypothetical protein